MNVRRIAAEVVTALPEDADFDDLEEFLFERACVERGREDCEAGRVRSLPDVLGADVPHSSTVILADSAATEMQQAIDEVCVPRDTLLAPILEAAQGTGSAKVGSITLPEMGDPSIRERHVHTQRGRYRLLYDTRGPALRILWFTSNTTCYRNVRPDPSAEDP